MRYVDYRTHPTVPPPPRPPNSFSLSPSPLQPPGEGTGREGERERGNVYTNHIIELTQPHMLRMPTFQAKLPGVMAW